MKKLYLIFRNSLCLVILMCMAVSIFPSVVMAQDNTSLFIVVDLMKVKPGDEANYIEMEKKVWKPIHQDRINNGKIVGWILYEVMYTGADDEYNFATVNVYANLANLENPFKGIDFEKIHPGKDINEEFEKTLNVRTLVKRQLLSRVNYANPEGGGSPAPNKYIVVNYMKTLPGGNFFQIEDEFAKPTAEELIKSGEWAGWSVWSNLFPRGTGMESDAVTVDNYPDFSNIGSANYMQAFEKAHPGKKWSEFADKLGKSRNIVRSELWKVIDFAFAEQ